MSRHWSDEVTCLALYPFVIVRVACDHCQSRRGSYRLARLAAKHGPETPLRDVLAAIAHDCPRPPPHEARGNQYHPRCHVHFPDLAGTPRPPDLPPGLAKLRLVMGGR